MREGNDFTDVCLLLTEGTHSLWSQVFFRGHLLASARFWSQLLPSPPPPPPKTAEWVLATWRAVRILRSSRRTFLFLRVWKLRRRWDPTCFRIQGGNQFSPRWASHHHRENSQCEQHLSPSRQQVHSILVLMFQFIQCLMVFTAAAHILHNQIHDALCALPST